MKKMKCEGFGNIVNVKYGEDLVCSLCGHKAEDTAMREVESDYENFPKISESNQEDYPPDQVFLIM